MCGRADHQQGAPAASPAWTPSRTPEGDLLLRTPTPLATPRTRRPAPPQPRASRSGSRSPWRATPWRPRVLRLTRKPILDPAPESYDWIVGSIFGDASQEAYEFIPTSPSPTPAGPGGTILDRRRGRADRPSRQRPRSGPPRGPHQPLDRGRRHQERWARQPLHQRGRGRRHRRSQQRRPVRLRRVAGTSSSSSSWGSFARARSAVQGVGLRARLGQRRPQR